MLHSPIEELSCGYLRWGTTQKYGDVLKNFYLFKNIGFNTLKNLLKLFF